MKWIIIALWVSSILFFYFRGKVRPSLSKTFIDHSVFIAPLNAVLVLTSKIKNAPFLPTNSINDLKVLQNNWHIFKKEATLLSENKEILAPKKKEDLGFNSFFKYGWKRFYLKWYDAKHPSAEKLCPNSVKILRDLPSVKAAMFAELPPGGKLNPHRDPYAGSLRYHLGLITPNSENCFILVDEFKYFWKDGEGVLFDETYIHRAENNTNSSRIILFCDIERPQKYKLVTFINKKFSKYIMSTASSPNKTNDEVGLLNKTTNWYWKLDSKRKKIKQWNKNVYRVIKVLFFISILFLLSSL